MVAGPRTIRARGRRLAPVAVHRLAGSRVSGERGCLVSHALRAGPLGLRLRRLPEQPDLAVHHRVELAEFPFGPDASLLLHSARRPRGLRLDTSDPTPRGVAGPLPLRGGTPDRAARRVPDARRRRSGRDAPGPRGLGDHGPALDGSRNADPGHRLGGRPRGPGRDGRVLAADRRVQRSERAPGADLHGVHMGRLLGGPPPGHVRRWADGPLRRFGAHRVHGGDEPDANPDPILSTYHVSYVVWAARTPLAQYLAHDPRWHVVDRTRVALVFARR